MFMQKPKTVGHIFWIVFLTATLSACVSTGKGQSVEKQSNMWARSAQLDMTARLNHKPNDDYAKNVIFFIGDGMGVSTVTAARILEGQLRGETGEENVLSFETFPYVALSKTYALDQQVTDSAAAASAFLTGVKSNARMFGVSPNAVQGDCVSSLKGRDDTLLELAEDNGIATGIISTARLTHATPAASYAHSPERQWESDADIPLKERGLGCTDIAAQFVNFNRGDGIDVIFAGGRREFLPNTKTGPEGVAGQREDGQNLIEAWKNKHENAQYIWNKAQFDDLDLSGPGPILGLFNPSHMSYERNRLQDKAGEPSIADMTEAAIRILENKDTGYFLFVEGGRIDHAHHKNNANLALNDTLALADAVARAVALTDDKETLIVVSADHSHTFVIAGYPRRGNPILGQVIEKKKRNTPALQSAVKLKDGKPYTTLGYYTGPGAASNGGARADLSGVDTATLDFRQQALLYATKGMHGGEDVAIYAQGPKAHLLSGVVEQNYIFHVLRHALQIRNENHQGD